MSVVYKQLIVKYGADIRDAIAGAERLDAAISKANKDIESRFGALTGKLRSVGMTMSAAITAPIAMAGLAAVNNAVHMETLRRSLDAVTGSSEQTAIQMKQLQEVAKLPGIGYKEAIQLAVGLQATGLAASEAQRYMKAFGNAIATVGGGKEELSAVSRQLQQMAGKKSPMMQDIRIIQDYVPQMMQAMKKLYGTTDTEQIQKMGIETKQFLSDIVGELENLPKVTSGTKIAIENLQDQWFRFSSAIGERAIPALVKITEVAASAMEQFNKLPVPMQLAAIGAVALTAAAGPLLLALAALPSVIAGVKTVMPIALSAFDTLALKVMYASDAIKAFASGGGIKSAITAFVSAGRAQLASDWDTLILKIMYAGDAVKSFASGSLETLALKFMYAGDAARKFSASAAIGNLKSIWETVTLRMMYATDAVKAFVAANGGVAGVVKNAMLNVAGAVYRVTAALKTMAVAAIQAFAPMLAVSAIVWAITEVSNAVAQANTLYENQADTLDDVNKRLDEYQKRLNKIAQGSGSGQGKAGVEAEIEKLRNRGAEIDEDMRSDQWKQKEDRFQRNVAKADQSGYWGGVKANIALRYKTVFDWVTGDSIGKAGYDELIKEQEENNKKLDAAKAKLKELEAEAAVQDTVKPYTEQATNWKLAGLAAAQAGEELKSAWAKINESYTSALAENAEKSAREVEGFNKALADKIALEQYKADKAEYFRNKMKTEQDRQETAIRKTEENQRKVLADRKQAADNIFTAISFIFAKQGISADSRGDEIGAAIASANEQFAQEYGRAAQAQLDGNPNWQRMIELAEMKRAEAIAKARDNARAKAAAEATTEKSAAYTLASMQASMNADEMQHLVEQTPLTSTQKLEVTAAIAGEQEAAAINTALASYTQKLNELNELKLKGIDVTNQAKQAELELQKAYVDAARARQKAIEQEVEALRQRKEQQIGFSSLTDMWRKGMIAGAREEFGDYAGRQRERAMAEVSMKQNAQGTREARDTEMVGLLREQVKKLTDMVGELKKQTPILKQAGVLQ